MILPSFHSLCLLISVLYQADIIDARHAQGTHHSHHAHHHNIDRHGEDSTVPVFAHVSPFNRTNEPLLELRDIMARQSGVTTAGQSGGSSSSASSDDFTCGPGKPCGNGACCGESGWCGYGSIYCGDGCQSNCGAKAECGKNAVKPGQSCPLNVCCSEFGFCGTTKDFCGKGCQSHCDTPKPKVSKTDTQKKIIGYYEAWSPNKACGVMKPSAIPVEFLTHLIFAFAFVSDGDFRITNMPDVPAKAFGEVTDMKQKNPNMKVLIALGGWTFNDPGPNQMTFSNAASTAANRKKFIKNLMGFMSQYGFDGADIDWEYPGAEDRGGREDDGVNFTKLLQELKAAFGKRYLLTFTAPTSYWYLRHFDIQKTSEAVDWINLMSYDLHGIWDRDNPIGAQVLGHTNLTEVDMALDLLWRNSVEPDKVVLGIGFYGRSFKLEDPKCNKPGCPFAGPGDKGPCSGEGGFLTYKEIQDILAKTKAKPYYDTEAEVKYMVYGDNNWISFDDDKTIQAKIDFANNRGLLGLMVWAIDIDDDKGTALKALTGNRKVSESTSLAQFLSSSHAAMSHSTDDPSKCYITDCESSGCANGWTMVGRANTDENGKNRCRTRVPSEARMICCPSFTGIKAESCRWDDSRSSALKSDCSGKCDIGEVEMVNDSFGWKGPLIGGSYGDQCGRGYKTFCCKAGNMERYLDICTWSECNEGCPSDKPNVLTTDTGGPKSNSRCSAPGSGGGGSPFDPSGGTAGVRKLCCPREDSFQNCEWSSSKVCSSTCGINQITLDLDPRGPDPKSSTCGNGRQKAFCCDPPGGMDRPFTPFDMENLFPPEYLPPADAIPSFDLVSFGGGFEHPIKTEDPNYSGVAFFLIAGDSTVGLTSMKKRDNPGLHFLSCPKDVLTRPNTEHQVARIVCSAPDVKGCFSVTEGGVEGTVVQMPDECGGPSFARAVSLELSKDQSISMRIGSRSPTSAVYDFKFDYNIDLVRRDTGEFSIRMDYSNVPGYWEAVVNSQGGADAKKRDLHELVERFYGDDQAWEEKFNALKFGEASYTPSDSIDVQFNRLVYDSNEICPSGDNGESESEDGISAAIKGSHKLEVYHGFSMIATWVPGEKIQVRQAAGFVRPEGDTEVTFKIGGTGALDTARSYQGSTMSKDFGRTSTVGQSVFKGWASFQGYYETGVSLHTRNAKGHDDGEVSFSGYMQGSMSSEWGRASINFPTGAAGSLEEGTGERQRRGDQAQLSSNTTLQVIEKAPGGNITLSSSIKVGLQVGLSFSRPWTGNSPDALPDISVSQEVFGMFNIENDVTVSRLRASFGTRQTSHLAKGSSAGWENGEKVYVSSANELDEQRFTTVKRDLEVDETSPISSALHPSGELSIRSAGDGKKPGAGTRLNDVTFTLVAAALRCVGCSTCVTTGALGLPCCGCACLDCDYPPEEDTRDNYVLETSSDDLQTRSLNPGAKLRLLSEEFEQSTEDEDSTLEERAGKKPYVPNPSAISDGVKKVNFLSPKFKNVYYPSFPNVKKASYALKKATWDTETKYREVLQYYHNSTSDCSDWSVGQAAQADTVWNGANTRDAQYETEHVLEGQTVGRFFSYHLPNYALQAQSTAWIMQELIDNATPYPGATDSIADMAALELGRNMHRDRLALFLKNSNLLKGQLFGIATPKLDKFKALKAGDEQMQKLKELGMIFTVCFQTPLMHRHYFKTLEKLFDPPDKPELTIPHQYMNTPAVWSAFCATHDAIYDIMAAWDAAHATQQPPPELAEEWKRHVKNELLSVKTKAKALAVSYHTNRKTATGILAEAYWFMKWGSVMSPLGQMAKIDFRGTCTHL